MRVKVEPLVSVVIPTHNRKEKLDRLLYSIFENDYSTDRLEIIVVDDGSSDGTKKEVVLKFPKAKLIRNENEMLIAGSRNIGMKIANGEYIFLVDDDNVIGKNCISELVKAFKHGIDSTIGIVAPIMYYFEHPNRIWCAGIERNMTTSRTKFIGKDEIDIGQFSNFVKSKDFPNSFMIKKDVTKKVGLFSEKIFPTHYEEADFGERVRRAGYEIVCNPKAKIWHDIPSPEKEENKARVHHVHSSLRAYYAGKNRIIFHKKYSKWWQYFTFIMIFNWFFALYYLQVILVNNKQTKKQRMLIAMAYLKGVIDGILYEACDFH